MSTGEGAHQHNTLIMGSLCEKTSQSVFLLICLSMYIYMCMHLYMCLDVYLCASICASICLYIYICIYMYMYIYMCIYMYIYIYPFYILGSNVLRQTERVFAPNDCTWGRSLLCASRLRTPPLFWMLWRQWSCSIPGARATTWRLR